MRHRHPEPESGLNLAPILNLVMILIPLLLISIEFEQLGVINVAVPGFVNVDPPTTEPLNLTVAVTHTGFRIGTTGQAPDPVPRTDPSGEPTVERYDFRALHERIEAIKENHPAETKFSLSADPDIPYELLVETMDTLRFRRDSTAPLFPDVTLAVIQ